MKYELTSSGIFYRKEKAEKLMRYGFKFSLIKDGEYRAGDYYKKKCTEIEINSLEDIMKLEESFESELIISVANKTIEIYDDYRE